MAKVLIEMSGGVIQATYSDDPYITIAIVDYDEVKDPIRSIQVADVIANPISGRFLLSEPKLSKKLREKGF